MTIGAHRGLSADAYHAVEAASASQLRVLHNQTPAHLAAQRAKPVVPSWEMILGELVHHAVLEPSRPFPKLAVVPDETPDGRKWDWRLKDCRQWREDVKASGLVVVSSADLDEIHRASERILANSEARELIEGSDTEVSLFWETTCRFPCKARLDMVPKGASLGDLKSTFDASPNGWQRHAWNMGYHLQAAWYLDGWEAVGDRKFDGFKFVVYEREVGLVKVHRCTSDIISAGREAYQNALVTYMDCTRNNKWPGYSEEAAEWDLPKWERNRL